MINYILVDRENKATAKSAKKILFKSDKTSPMSISVVLCIIKKISLTL